MAKLTKAEAARLNGKKGGRPRKNRAQPTAPAAKPTDPVQNRTPKGARQRDRRQTRTLKAQAAFLREFGTSGNVLRACQAAGVGRSTLYHEWMLLAAFKALYEQAREDAADLLEEEARRRAVNGVDKPVFYRGGRCGLIREYSDTLLIFLLKGKRPDVYRERVDHEHKHKISLEDLAAGSWERPAAANGAAA